MFRGVNLGPHRRIKMDALRGVYEGLKFQNVQTYVQSGNVVFHTKEADLVRLAKRIGAAFEKEFGFSSEVLLRTAAEMQSAIARNPFTGRGGIEPNRLLVVFLGADPGDDARQKVRALKTDTEELFIDGREIYIYYRNGMARPKLNMAHVEKAVKTAWTGRNWNSVTKLLEMAQALD